MKKSRKTAVVIGVVVALAVGLVGYNNFSGTSRSGGNNSTEVPCINPSLPVPSQYHIHPNLRITVNGEKISVPSGLGLGVGCERAIHTHDTSGQIHIEPNFYQEFTLGDFFNVWGKPFTRDQILEYSRDASHEIKMTVDGGPNEEFEELVLKDKQEIVIEYRTIEAP